MSVLPFVLVLVVVLLLDFPSVFEDENEDDRQTDNVRTLRFTAE